MLEKNQIYEVEIIDNGYQGEGIAKIDNFPIFIQGVIKGEQVEIKILKVLSNFAYAKILKIIKPSEYRTDADCSDFPKCGGCNLRHIKYDYTLKVKKAKVENCLYKALNRKLKVNDVIGMDNPLNYRNKLQYPVGLGKDNNPVMGVYSERTHNIVPVQNCFIQNEECNKIANKIFKFIKENNISVYNEQTLKGTVRHIVIRIGVKTNEVLVTLVVNDNNFKKEKELVEYLTAKYPNIKSVVKNYNTKNTNVILGNQNEIIYGKGYIHDILGDYKFKISPLSFYQVNPIQTEILYGTAIKYVDADIAHTQKNNIALDLYCGIGTIGIFASKHFKKVYGVEIVEQAIEDAKENAKINNVENIEFYAGDVEKVLPQILENIEGKPKVVFVDPPRKGLDNKTIEILKTLKPEKIVYISCNPATLARDLKQLEEKYEIKEVQPVDMFPYTSHVECVAALQQKQDT